MKNKLKIRFTLFEALLYAFSVVVIVTMFCVFDRKNFLTLAASLIGVTSLIICAKGHPAGQVLMIVFSIIYGVVSIRVRYYGETITYVGMTLPMAVFSLVSWLRNPFEKGKREVKVNKLSGKETAFMCLLTAVVTAAFYFILKALDTNNIVFSTISIATSFLAAYLTLRRSAFFAFAYAMNDVVLIVLWVLATIENMTYVSVAICFCVFFVNDLYCFVCWLKMKKRQHAASSEVRCLDESASCDTAETPENQ